MTAFQRSQLMNKQDFQIWGYNMITDYRKKHIWAVADLMKKFALENGKIEQEANELYTLGLLHDIGYEFASEKDYFYHNQIGGAI